MASELPMPEPTVPRKPFSSFKAITFDIYGTLIDWETGIIEGLQGLVSRIPADSPYSIYRNSTSGEGRIKLAEKFNEIEARLETEHPGMKYDEIQERIYLTLLSDFGLDTRDADSTEAKRFGASIGSWPAFPDTVEACERLAKYYKLIPITNVDTESFKKTRAGPLKGVDFFRAYTAQDIGSYKPDLRNFEYLMKHVKEEAGADKGEILHVAQSIFHDQRPAKKVGLSSVWINRSGAGMGSAGGVQGVHERGEVGYGWRFGPSIPTARKTNSLAFAKSDCHACSNARRTCDRQRPYCRACQDANDVCQGYSMPLVWQRGFSIRENPNEQRFPIKRSNDGASRKRKRRPGEFVFITNIPPKRRKDLNNHGPLPASGLHTRDVAPSSNSGQRCLTAEARSGVLGAVATPLQNLDERHWTASEIICNSKSPPGSTKFRSSNDAVNGLSPLADHNPGSTNIYHCGKPDEIYTEDYDNDALSDDLERVEYDPGEMMMVESSPSETFRPSALPECKEMARRERQFDNEEPSDSSQAFTTLQCIHQQQLMLQSLGPQILFDNTSHRFSILLDIYDREYCTYPITVDNGTNPFRYRQDTSAGSQHLLHAVIALACHHRKWPSIQQSPPTEVTQHQGQAVTLFRNALQTSATEPRRLSMLDTLLALWCIDATQSALSMWRNHLRVAYDLLEGAGGASSWSLSSRVQAQVSMFMWWDGVVALLSRRPCIFPYSYLETVLPWEGVQAWGFFDLNGCPRELLVPMIQLANLTEHLDGSGKLPANLRALITDIEENIRNYKPADGAPTDDFVVDLPEEEAETYFNMTTDHYHNCEAFRYALLIYILRVFKRVEGIPSYRARLGHLSRLVLDHVISIQDSSSIRKQLLLAVFLAGAETKSDSHRGFIRDYCAKWFDVYGYQMFTTALEILEELWSSNETDDGEIWWGDVLDVRRRTDTRNSEADFCFG
ncbi:hypothetical protein LTS07_002205 [Exophiala sideris]|uniref:Zn(2)-C6 fungal-type domain-containing protein n=1 Tax=Exophiala sideris TaxID=1016849 RepID=A0ABR0JLM8_9EURO|nr:hypothetical protein LTS07_002205 [Exophiala sideris]KAK5041693.1 hypothetical protein LTR13_002360 [Exophiala sideris]KAK5066861.1 hypothetical protein LTR69_002209 [Exophiala sideris]KAK5184920.1 hypothetical protein LTR44_002766 [Eurotiomycetes sp. CCFEE 6388]